MKATIVADCEQDIKIGDREYLICYTITARCYYQRAKISGPPEDCYPEESDMEIEIEVISATDAYGYVVPLSPLFLVQVTANLNTEKDEEAIWEEFFRGDVD